MNGWRRGMLVTVVACVGLAVAAGAAEARPKTVRVALVMKSLANDFFRTMEEGARAHQKEHADQYELIANGIKEAVAAANMPHKPVAVSFVGGEKSEAAMRWLVENGIPAYPAPDLAVNAMAALREYAVTRAAAAQPFKRYTLDLRPLQACNKAAMMGQ